MLGSNVLQVTKLPIRSYYFQHVTVTDYFQKVTSPTLMSQLKTLVGCVAQWAERRSLAGELTLSCARPAADG